MKKIFSLLLLCVLLVGCKYKVEEKIIPENNNDIEQIEEQEVVEKTIDEEFVENQEEIIPLDEDLVKILDYIPNIIIDLKYATTDNFTGNIIYESGEAYLRYGTLKKLTNVREKLNEKGYSLVIWDAYRPIEAQFKFWEVCPINKYVADPNNGYSNHSRGNTVDVSIINLDGTEVTMPSKFDEFSQTADRDYSDVSEKAKINALLLEDLMKEYGFKPYFSEWWHYQDEIVYDVIK